MHAPMQSTRREVELHEQKVKEFELRRKMQTVLVPTDDVKVREMLRSMGEPITLFGEREVSMASSSCVQLPFLVNA